jgi:uncharacterized protein YkwD
LRTRINLAICSFVLLIAVSLSAKTKAADDSNEVIHSGPSVTSKALGVETVAGGVLFRGIKNPGLYINAAPGNDTLAKRMGLKAGNVLLTLDGFSANSAEAVDRWMSRRPDKPLQFTYAVLEHGHPKLYEKRLSRPPKTQPVALSSSGASSSGGHMAAAGTGSASNLAAADPSQAATPAGAGNYSSDELESYDLSLINQSRRAEGSPDVQPDSALARLARDYADYMMQHPERYVSPQFSPHVDLQGRIPQMRASDAGINREVHENLNLKSRGRFDDKVLVQQMHERMMAEPAGQHNHRSIMLDPRAKAVGIGIARKGTLIYMVEEFGH